jgi:hypothetical protein
VFWLGVKALWLFWYKLGVAPGSGYYPPSQYGFGPWLGHLILPWVVLALLYAAWYARDYLDGADWRTLSGSWVGPRPVTADGLPLIGATRRPGLFVAGGHGMWGMTLGPATGRLLADLIATGRRPAALESFDPCR